MSRTPPLRLRSSGGNGGEGGKGDVSNLYGSRFDEEGEDEEGGEDEQREAQARTQPLRLYREGEGEGEGDTKETIRTSLSREFQCTTDTSKVDVRRCRATSQLIWEDENGELHCILHQCFNPVTLPRPPTARKFISPVRTTPSVGRRRTTEGKEIVAATTIEASKWCEVHLNQLIKIGAVSGSTLSVVVGGGGTPIEDVLTEWTDGGVAGLVIENVPTVLPNSVQRLQGILTALILHQQPFSDRLNTLGRQMSDTVQSLADSMKSSQRRAQRRLIEAQALIANIEGDDSECSRQLDELRTLLENQQREAKERNEEDKKRIVTLQTEIDEVREQAKRSGEQAAQHMAWEGKIRQLLEGFGTVSKYADSRFDEVEKKTKNSMREAERAARDAQAQEEEEEEKRSSVRRSATTPSVRTSTRGGGGGGGGTRTLTRTRTLSSPATEGEEEEDEGSTLVRGLSGIEGDTRRSVPFVSSPLTGSSRGGGGGGGGGGSRGRRISVGPPLLSRTSTIRTDQGAAETPSIPRTGEEEREIAPPLSRTRTIRTEEDEPEETPIPSPLPSSRAKYQEKRVPKKSHTHTRRVSHRSHTSAPPSPPSSSAQYWSRGKRSLPLW